MDIFKDLITCQLCNNRMKDPRCLPCLHAFCFDCLNVTATLTPDGSPASLDFPSPPENSAGQIIQCVTCTSVFKGLIVEHLPQDFKVLQIIERLRQKEIDESQSCFEHKKKLELFCYSPNCLTSICYKCSITSHQNHDVAELKDHLQLLLSRLNEVERRASQTVENMNMYHNRQTRLKTLGNKLKQLVENKVKCLILEEKFRNAAAPVMADSSDIYLPSARGDLGVVTAGGNGCMAMLNQLQLRLLDVKEKITKEGETTNYQYWNSRSQMKEVHDSVVSVIRDLNDACQLAMSSIRAKQISDLDLELFSSSVRDLLRTGHNENETSSVLGAVVVGDTSTESDSGIATGLLSAAPLEFYSTSSPIGSGRNIRIGSGVETTSNAEEKASTDLGDAELANFLYGAALNVAAAVRPEEENLVGRNDDVSSIVSSKAGSDIVNAAFNSCSLDETASNSTSCSKDSPNRLNQYGTIVPQHQQQTVPFIQNPSSQSNYANVKNNAQVIVRFQVVNPTFDKFTDIRDCALLGDDFVVIDKRNEWIKSYDIGVGRYIGTNNKGFTDSPVGVHTLTNNTMLLAEQTVHHFCELYFVNKDMTEKDAFRPELPPNERIHDVCTSPTGQIILSTKSMNVYEQHAITSEFGTRVSKWREIRFNKLFNANFMISHMAVSATGFIALGNAEDNLIYLYDRNGRHKWKFPVRENTSFKRLKQINFDLAGNLITVDNYYQQVQVISRQGKLIRVLHGRSLQFARPICAIPRGDNQIVVMSEFGSVVIIEKYL